MTNGPAVVEVVGRRRRVDRVHGVVDLGGDAQVQRKAAVLPAGHFELFDPFLMMAEDWFSTPGFDWHPHRGIETVTFVLDGALEHGDNRGNAGALGPGDIQWMTAGSGIIHRELAYRDEHVHTLQLWVNLPASLKLVESHYQDLTRDRLAAIESEGVRVEVVSGRSSDVVGPASTHWPITGFQLTIEPGRSLQVSMPGEDRAFLYVLAGRVLAGRDRTPLTGGQVAWSDPVPDEDETSLELDAPDGDVVVRAILFSGRPIREPVVAGGPFVMTTPDEIRQAFRDFHAGRFGPVPRLARL